MSEAADGCPEHLGAILREAAAAVPDRPAAIFNNVSRSYAEAADRANRLASGLSLLGVQKGDRVAIWASNCPEFLEILFGAPLIGAIAVPLDHWLEEKSVLAAVAQVRPKVIIVGAAQANSGSKLLDRFLATGVDHVLALGEAEGLHSYEETLAAAEPLSTFAPLAQSDPAMILFTSGSTGRSKGAVHTHGGLCATAAIMRSELGLQDGERTLHFLPMFSSCLEQLIPLTLARATHVIMPQFEAQAVWDSIATNAVTHVNAVPTVLRRLLDRVPRVLPASLRLISYASEPMPPPLITELLKRLPRMDFVQFYGMIEQLCLAVQSPEHQLRKIGTVGRPMAGAELRIVTTDGDGSSGDEFGEIVARSPTMFAGYWEDSAATSQVMRDGWMRTGDLGQFDNDGFLVLRGRAKEIVKSGGVTVIPSEVEATLMAHPSVCEVAVVGIPDDTWGEAVHAFVVLNDIDLIGETELLAFCRSQLAGYKTPKRIHFVHDLPRTGIGKVSRRQVRDQYLGQHTTGVAA